MGQGLARRCALTAVLMAAGLARADGQSTLRILRVTPTDSGAPGTFITVTFDRPVAGMLGRSPDPARAMSLAPAFKGTIEWRDPATLRFVPAEPFTPGSNVTVAIDTAVVASAGTRTAPPYRFSVRIPGPTPIELPNTQGLGPMPTMSVVYSAPVDLAATARVSRIELLPSCGGGVVPLIAIRQRPVAANFSGDSVTNRFARIVDLVPRDSLPPGCGGTLRIASFDPGRPNDSWGYRFTTVPLFTVRATPCLFNTTNPRTVCDPDGLRVEFSVSVATTQVQRYLQVSPALAPPPLVYFYLTSIDFGPRLVPRQRYTVTVDTAIRGFLGRRLTGPNVLTIVAHDRVPGVRQQSGIATIAPSMRTVTVRAVNVERLRMTVTPIPDSLLTAVLGPPGFRPASIVGDLERAQGDSLSVDIPVHARFNAETTLVVRLPNGMGTASGPRFRAVRFAIVTTMTAPDSIGTTAAGKPTHGPIDTGRTGLLLDAMAASKVSNLAMIAQVSGLVAHAKLGDARGALFVTRTDGSPVAQASVTLYDSAWGTMARARTDASGLATLERLPDVPALDRPARYLDIAVIADRTHGADRLILPVTPDFGPTDRSPTLLVPLDPEALGAHETAPWQVHGAVTTDRDLYRPGELLHVKGYIRRGLLGALETPTADSVRLLLRGSPNWTDTVPICVTVLDRFGAVTDSLRLPEGLRLGSYNVQLEARERRCNWMTFRSAPIRVLEFRAPEFLVSLRGDSTLRFIGDTIVATLSANYLFGAPMAGATVQWNVTAPPPALKR